VFERRRFLAAAGTGIATLLAGCAEGRGVGGESTATETDSSTEAATEMGDTEAATEMGDTEAVEVIVDNVGTTAWEFVGESGVAGDGENPTITLEPETRYVVENRGWSTHPFAFLSDDGTSLLTQADGGTLADDADVDWRDDGEQFAFTVTPELADAVDRYVCTVHARMQGDVATGTRGQTETSGSGDAPGGDY
jgi:hypothetical protein